MADPESPAPKPKRKRCTTTSVDTGEMTEMIMDELEKARERIDRRLTKYNDSILQAQSAKRQRFIDYCESEIGGLPGGLRSSLATSLLSSEDFAVKMNFSELHTSSAKSHLTWSCGDASLSDPSWRKGTGLPGEVPSLTSQHDQVLQKYAEGAAEASSTRTKEPAQRSHATRKGSAPLARTSLPTAKPARPSSSTARAEDDYDPFEGPDDIDPISIQQVTISKTRSKTNTGPQAAPPSQEAGPRKGPRGTLGRATPSKARIHWTQEEISKLKSLCAGKPEALSGGQSPFWKSIEAQLLPRSAAGCWHKWKEMRGPHKTRRPRAAGDDAPKRSWKAWSAEDLAKLEQLRPRVGKSIDLDRAVALFPERTRSSVVSKCDRYFRGWCESRGVGRAATAADKSSGKSKGDEATREDENGTETGSDGGIP